MSNERKPADVDLQEFETIPVLCVLDVTDSEDEHLSADKKDVSKKTITVDSNALKCSSIKEFSEENNSVILSKTSEKVKKKKKRNRSAPSYNKLYFCSFCKKSFSQWSTKTNHERTHTGERPYSCSFCGKTFSHLSTKNNHERVHTGEKPYQCNFCEKRFSDRSTKKAHERLHTGEKPYHCSICGKPFAQLGNKKQHELIHLGEEIYKTDKNNDKFGITEPVSGRQQKYETVNAKDIINKNQCRFCGKLFAHPRDTRQHENSHLNDGAYKVEKEEEKISFPQQEIIKKEQKETIIVKDILIKNRCQFCGEFFGLVTDRKQHELMLHFEELCKVLKNKETVDLTNCKNMKKELKRETTFIKDIITPHQCQFCGELFGKASDTKRHELMFHFEELCNAVKNKELRGFIEHIDTKSLTKIEHEKEIVNVPELINKLNGGERKPDKTDMEKIGNGRILLKDAEKEEKKSEVSNGNNVFIDGQKDEKFHLAEIIIRKNVLNGDYREDKPDLAELIKRKKMRNNEPTGDKTDLAELIKRKKLMNGENGQVDLAELIKRKKLVGDIQKEYKIDLAELVNKKAYLNSEHIEDGTDLTQVERKTYNGEKREDKMGLAELIKQNSYLNGEDKEAKIDLAEIIKRKKLIQEKQKNNSDEKIDLADLINSKDLFKAEQNEHRADLAELIIRKKCKGKLEEEERIDLAELIKRKKMRGELKLWK